MEEEVVGRPVVLDMTEVVRVEGAAQRAPGPEASNPRIVH
jgi:hypothetical protein